MMSLHPAWRAILIGVLLVVLVVSCFWGVCLYRLAAVWVERFGRENTLSSSWNLSFPLAVLFMYGYAGFNFFRQKLNR